MLVQTDLYSFSYKKGSILPWCKKCGAENFYKDGKLDDVEVKHASGQDSKIIIDAVAGRFAALDFYHDGAAKWGLGMNSAGDFYLDRSGIGNTVTILSSNRNVGIGTATPSQKLDVSGNINVAGNITVNSGITLGGEYKTAWPTASGGQRKKVGVITIDFASFTNLISVPYTGIGFQPSLVMFTAYAYPNQYSWGVDTISTQEVIVQATDGTGFSNTGYSIGFWKDGGTVCATGQINSMDPDGFTIGWWRFGTGCTTGNGKVIYTAFE